MFGTTSRPKDLKRGHPGLLRLGSMRACQLTSVHIPCCGNAGSELSMWLF
jgi:hypothetical protein